MPDVAIAPPAAPAAPVSPAPAAPAPSAPTSSEPTATQASTAPVETQQTPAAASKPPRPKKEDYPESEEGVRQFANDAFAYDDEHGAGEESTAAQPVPAEAPTEGGEQAEKPAEAEAAPDAPVAKPADEQPESLTPESLAELEKQTPALKELFDAHPTVKGRMFQMARENAKLSALGELWPHENAQQAVEAAKFDKEVASRTTSIKSAFLASEQDPALIGSAIEQFYDEFRVYDEQGKPVSDERGNPVFGKDLELLTKSMTDARLGESVEYAKARLASGQLSERQRDNYEALVQAIEFIQKFESASELDMDTPDISDLDEASKEHFRRREEAIKKREEEVGLRQKQEDAKAKAGARQTSEQRIAQSVATGFGERLVKLVNEETAGNRYFPRFALEDKNPATGRPYFYDKVWSDFMLQTIGYNIFNRKFEAGKGIAKLKAQFGALEAKPPSPEVEQQRVALFNQVMDDHMPRIARAELKRISAGHSAQVTAANKTADAARAQLQPEPSTASALQPKIMTDDLAFQKAREVLSKDPSFQRLDRYEQEIKVMDEAQKHMR